MKSRWISAILCLLYLSMGLLAGAHDHSEHALSGHQQCDACAWHHNTEVDVPVTKDRIPVPEGILVAHEAPSISAFQAACGIHESRGPPSIPQL
jgi:hypothetical protein